MLTHFNSGKHVFSLNDLTLGFDGIGFSDAPSFLDTTALVVPQIVDKDGNVLSAIDSEFGFYVDDYLGAAQKSIQLINAYLEYKKKKEEEKKARRKRNA